MEEFTLLAATGMLGSGFSESSIRKGLEAGARVVACDAGSTDPGPHSLATGRPQFSVESLRRDTACLVRAACGAGIPLIIGSCGTAGGDDNLAIMRALVQDVVGSAGAHLRLAVVHSEVPADRLEQLRLEGRVRPLIPSGELTQQDVVQSLHTVAMMGAEPLQAALDAGAQVVLAGRCSDAALYAAAPLMAGFSPAASWHAGMILECGAAAVEMRTTPDSLIGTVYEDGSFEVEPLRDEYTCTPRSVAAHTLYEQSDPFRRPEPSGAVLTEDCRFEAVSDRRVRVTGSRFEPAGEYTVKLEGAHLAGYSTIVIGAIRDPVIVGQLGSWLERLDGALAAHIGRLADIGPYEFATRVYGKDGVMGHSEPDPVVRGNEVAILWDVVAPSQERARAIASIVSHMALHNPVPEWRGLISSLAFPFSPAEVDRGPVYEFHLNHLARLEHPRELFDMELVDL